MDISSCFGLRQALSRRSFLQIGPASLFTAGDKWDMTDDELYRIPGFGPDVAAPFWKAVITWRLP